MRNAITRFSRSLTLALLLFVVAVCSQSLIAQRRRPARPQPTPTSRIDYSRFSHSTRQHQESCNSCHKAPTANWRKASGFPDIADFPGHDACVRCHRSQFFKGAQPIICSNCHTRVSPRDDARFTFRNPNKTRQFKIEFPHDKHQDVIALLRIRPVAVAALQNRPRSWLFAHAVQDRTDYNNCTICHSTNKQAAIAPAAGWTDGFVPAPDSFKTVTTSHAACFNCHWKNQPPTKDNCGDCHKLQPPYLPKGSPARISMKFRHEGGGEKQVHLAECTTCHINITKSASSRGLKPDVPITGCTECHNKSGLREDLGKELSAIDKDNEFVCTYCHTSDVGRRDPPAGHSLVAERKPLRRKDAR